LITLNGQRRIEDQAPTRDTFGSSKTEPFHRAVVYSRLTMVHAPQPPDLQAQQSAMRQLDFLIGTWVGSARLLRGPGTVVELDQTERAEYRLDGLALLIEGTGRERTSGAAVLQALGIISYDDDRHTYRMRAFNDGRVLETDVTLVEPRRAISWGFVMGDISTRSVLRLDDDGAWTERAELMIGVQAPKTLLELSVYRHRAGQG
jgi:hypothetical protein